MKKIVQASSVETRCKQLIRQFKGHVDAADRLFRELTTLANEEGVNRNELAQWFEDEGYAQSTAYSYASSIIKVVRRAHAVVKARIKSGQTTFKEANEITTLPYKTEQQKRETLWLRQLTDSVNNARLNKVSRIDFHTEVDRIFDAYEQEA